MTVKSCDADALNETSGVSRWPSAGTPGPTCHDGLVNLTLAPPPVAEMGPVVSPLESFHAVSGMYEKAEGATSFVDPFQYWVGWLGVVAFVVSPVNVVPPMAVE